MNTRQAYQAAYRAARIAGYERTAAYTKQTKNRDTITYKARYSFTHRWFEVTKWDRCWIDGELHRVTIDYGSIYGRD